MSKERKDPAYLREQGQKRANQARQRKITFCLSQHIDNQGQTLKEWEQLGLLADLMIRLKQVGQYSALDARKEHIKEYTKVSFPPNSKFLKPKHITAVTWAVMHIKPNSKEVVVGYLDDDVFYIVFLDKEHDFWPTELKHT